MVWFGPSSVVDAGSNLGEAWGLGGSFYTEGDGTTNPSHAVGGDGSGDATAGGDASGTGGTAAGDGTAGGTAAGGTAGGTADASAGGASGDAASDKTVFCTMHGGIGHRIHGDTCFQIADFCKGNATLNYGELWTAGDCASVGHTSDLAFVDQHATAFKAFKKP